MKNNILLGLLIFFGLLVNAAIGQVAQDIKITNIDHVNSAALEFSPIFYHHGLVYVSSESRHGLKDYNINENTFELFYADISPKGKLSKPAPLSLKLNTKYHEGPVSFGEDMNLMFFTQANIVDGKPVKDKNGRVQLKIYQASRGKEDWEKQKALPFNDDQYSCLHPSITKDGKRLYFASDRPGGYGGMDIYYADLKNGKWGDPVNLGPKVNTAVTDAFPNIHPSGKLFFSSNRKYGMGGLDIYMVDVRDEEPGEVVALPEPINSFLDDLGFMISNKGTIAFFASNRPGGKGKDDIYRADIPNGLKGLFPPQNIEMKVIVKNQNTLTPIEGAHVKIAEIPELTYLYSMNDVFDKSLVRENGALAIRYRIDETWLRNNSSITNEFGQQTFSVTDNKKYLIAGAKNGFVSGFINFNTFDRNKKTVELLLAPESKKEEIVVPVHVVLEVGSLVVLDQIFYDFDKSYIRSDASRGLDVILQLMLTYPEMKIDLTAHTDSRGEKAYNQKLSDQRAISAKYFLTSRGIEEHRIKALGKGESNPRNDCKDGVKCSEMEHQYNRRTEIKITSLGTDKTIKYIDNKPEYIDKAKKN